MASGLTISWQIDGETVETMTDFIFGAPKSLQMVTAATKIRHLLFWRKVITNLDSMLKSRDITLPTKVRLFKAVVFPVVMYEWESWTRMKAACWRIYVFELWCWTRLLSPLDCTEIQSVHPKGNQSWVFIGRSGIEAGTPILWPPDAKSWLIWKDPDAGKDWRQEEKETTEDEMVGWHHQLNGHESEQTPGDSEGQGSLVCCGPLGSHRDRKSVV